MGERLSITDLQQNFGSDVVNDKLRDLVSGQAGNMLTFLASALTSVTGAGFAIFNVLTLAIVTPVVGFYLLRDWPRLIGMVDSWLPHRYAEIIRAQAREVDRILSAWVRGQALCCIILALYYALALTVVGLDLGLIVGMAAGLLSFIPYVGSITGGVTALGLAMAQFPHWRGVIAVGCVLIVGQTLEGYVIYPRFLGDRVELPAVWVIFALFAGAAAFGFLGVMLAVPVAATIGCAVPLLAPPLPVESALPGPAFQTVAGTFAALLASVARNAKIQRDTPSRRQTGRIKRCQERPRLRSEWEPRVLSIVRIVVGLSTCSTAFQSSSTFRSRFRPGSPRCSRFTGSPA